MGLLQECVVGVDGSEGSGAAFGWAVAQAVSSGGEGKVVAVHAFAPAAELFAAAAQVNLDPVRAEHERLLHHEWIVAAQGTDVEVDTVLVDDAPAPALLRASRDNGGAPIVVGRRPDGVLSHHVGHLAGQLLHMAEGPVILVNHETEPAPVAGPVVVAVHGPVEPTHAPVKWAARFAEQRALDLHVVSVTAPIVADAGFGFPEMAYRPDLDEIERANAEAVDTLARALAEAHPAVAVTSEAAYGHPSGVLAELVSEKNAGLVVIGSHHPSTVLSFLSDGIARSLPTRVACPVVTIPAD